MKRYVKSAVLSILDEDSEAKYDLAFETDPEILTALSDDTEDWVVGAVGLNPHTPKNILVKLSNHPNYGVRYNVAQNFNTPTRTLRKLAKDRQYQVRNAVLRNDNTPIDVIEYAMEHDPDSDVREVACYELKRHKELNL